MIRYSNKVHVHAQLRRGGEGNNLFGFVLIFFLHILCVRTAAGLARQSICAGTSETLLVDRLSQ